MGLARSRINYRFRAISTSKTLQSYPQYYMLAGYEARRKAQERAGQTAEAETAARAAAG